MTARSHRLRWVGGAALGAAAGAAAGAWLAMLVALLLYVAAEGQLSSTALIVLGCVGGGGGALIGLAIGPAWALRGHRPGRYNHATDVWGRPLEPVKTPVQPTNEAAPVEKPVAQAAALASPVEATEESIARDASASVVCTAASFVYCTTGRLRITGVVDTSASETDQTDIGLYPLR